MTNKTYDQFMGSSPAACHVINIVLRDDEATLITELMQHYQASLRTVVHICLASAELLQVDWKRIQRDLWHSRRGSLHSEGLWRAKFSLETPKIRELDAIGKAVQSSRSHAVIGVLLWQHGLLVRDDLIKDE